MKNIPENPKTGKCQLAKKKCDIAVHKGDVTGFKDVEPHSQQALMEALAQQPVSVSLTGFFANFPLKLFSYDMCVSI